MWVRCLNWFVSTTETRLSAPRRDSTQVNLRRARAGGRTVASRRMFQRPREAKGHGPPGLSIYDIPGGVLVPRVDAGVQKLDQLAGEGAKVDQDPLLDLEGAKVLLADLERVQKEGILLAGELNPESLRVVAGMLQEIMQGKGQELVSLGAPFRAEQAKFPQCPHRKQMNTEISRKFTLAPCWDL